MTSPQPWPKLSLSLYGPKHPMRCQHCGNECDLDRWQECDEYDQPTPVVVVLCRDCSTALIDRHPRLYHDLHHNAPHPGSMVMCIDCNYRTGVSCAHPDLGANGGSGLAIRSALPETIFMDGRTGDDEHVGWIEQVYPIPPTLCVGRRVSLVSTAELPDNMLILPQAVHP